MRVRALQGDTLDVLCHRHLGRTAGLVEQVLALNPALAELGPLLPNGTPVTLPEPTEAAAEQQPLIQLWD